MAIETRLKLVPGVPMVRVRDTQGKLHDFLHQAFGPTVLPEWALHDDEQVQHLLELGLCELSDVNGNATDPGRVWECVSALIAVGLPADAGAPRARDALRSNGFRYSNQTIADAVAVRRSGKKFGEQ